MNYFLKLMIINYNYKIKKKAFLIKFKRMNNFNEIQINYLSNEYSGCQTIEIKIFFCK